MEKYPSCLEPVDGSLVRISKRPISVAALSTVITGTPGNRSRSSSTAEFARTRPSCSLHFASGASVFAAYASASLHDRFAAVAKVRNQALVPAERSGLVGAPMCDVPVCGETCDVVTRPGGEDEADRRDPARRKPAPAKDHMDQRTARSSVAIGEGVDRLELGVGDGCLGERGMVVAIDVGQQICDNRSIDRNPFPANHSRSTSRTSNTRTSRNAMVASLNPSMGTGASAALNGTDAGGPERWSHHRRSGGPMPLAQLSTIIDLISATAVFAFEV